MEGAAGLGLCCSCNARLGKRLVASVVLSFEADALLLRDNFDQLWQLTYLSAGRERLHASNLHSGRHAGCHWKITVWFSTTCF